MIGSCGSNRRPSQDQGRRTQSLVTINVNRLPASGSIVGGMESPQAAALLTACCGPLMKALP
jgi:hypothetical protein